MKNIHILPTDKASRLYYFTVNKAGYYLYQDDDKVVPKKAESNYASNTFVFKIILTTNQKLIKNDVQAIDDDFLELFFKNRNYKNVEIKESYSMFQLTYSGIEYEIVIPKEESKQEESISPMQSFKIKEEPKQQCKDCNDNLTDFTFIEDTVDMKQDTPEEETLAKIKFVLSANNNAQAIRLIEQYGEWQKEQILDFLYSEITERRDYSASKMCEKVIEFIEQFKNK